MEIFREGTSGDDVAALQTRLQAHGNALAGNDLAAARRPVNGGRHGLDRFESAYRIGLELPA